eukprot:comp14165_c0_seq1/m.20211 comp14165_c0_seq1/g.20211  ORF comp14165_c0_seq1/g.20211 comp14165_c0_seq1/m.20211 type:complete len:185 (-) comp14165_c0_seq1:68-622(-)
MSSSPLPFEPSAGTDPLFSAAGGDPEHRRSPSPPSLRSILLSTLDDAAVAGDNNRQKNDSELEERGQIEEMEREQWKENPVRKYIDTVTHCVDTDDLNAVKEMQRAVAGDLNDTLQFLKTLNDDAEAKFNDFAGKFRNHTALVDQLKDDLGLVFRRIRSIREKIKRARPGAIPDYDDELSEGES